MRLSHVFNPRPRQQIAGHEQACTAPGELQAQRGADVVAPAPWPPHEPPDDLDQRVRQVGEWQLGDW